MPFKSRKQIAKFWQLENEGKLKEGTTENWIHETKNIKSLPMRIKSKTKGKMAKYKLGGEVGQDEKKKKPGQVQTTKEYPVTNPKEKKPNIDAGRGEIKQIEDKSGVKKYHKNPETGKMEEYDATRYVDSKSKSTAVKKESAAPTRSMPRFNSATFFNKGGLVGGKGTGKSDSNPGKITRGSFIIPAAVREKLKKVLTDKKADMDQEDGEDVMLSKGEEVVDPDETEETDRVMKKNGIKKGINILAPKSKRKFSRGMFVKKKK